MKQPKTIRRAFDRTNVRKPKWEPEKLNWGAPINRWPKRVRKAVAA